MKAQEKKIAEKKSIERRAMGVAGGAHALFDGYKIGRAHV